MVYTASPRPARAMSETISKVNKWIPRTRSSTDFGELTADQLVVFKLC